MNILGECSSGSIACLPENRREAQDQGIGRGRPGQGRRYDGLIRARTVVNKDLESLKV